MLNERVIKEQKVNGQQMSCGHLNYQRPTYAPLDAHRHHLLPPEPKRLNLLQFHGGFLEGDCI